MNNINFIFIGNKFSGLSIAICFYVSEIPHIFWEKIILNLESVVAVYYPTDYKLLISSGEYTDKKRSSNILN